MLSDLFDVLFGGIAQAMPRWAFWLLLAALLLTLQYWLGPLMIHAKVRQKRATRFSPAGSAPPMPPQLATFFAESGAALQQAGFTATPPFYAVTGDEHTGGAAFFQLFRNAEHGDVATVMAMARPLPVDGSPPITLVGFTTELVNGGSQRTGNALMDTPVPPRPNDHVARFPNEREAGRLYALHRELVRRRGVAVRSASLEDPVAYQRRQELLTHQRMVSSGWYFAAGDELRPTWKGACLGAWKMLSPWKDRIAARHERLRRELSSDLGFA